MLILSRHQIETACQIWDDISQAQLILGRICVPCDQDKHTAERLAGLLRMIVSGLEMIGLPKTMPFDMRPTGIDGSTSCDAVTRYIRPADQEAINSLRIDLATAMIELAGLHVTDYHSQDRKSELIDRVRRIAANLDALGVRHSNLQQEARHDTAGSDLSDRPAAL